MFWPGEPLGPSPGLDASTLTVFFLGSLKTLAEGGSCLGGPILGPHLQRLSCQPSPRLFILQHWQQ